MDAAEDGNRLQTYLSNSPRAPRCREVLQAPYRGNTSSRRLPLLRYNPRRTVNSSPPVLKLTSGTFHRHNNFFTPFSGKCANPQLLTSGDSQPSGAISSAISIFSTLRAQSQPAGAQSQSSSEANNFDGQPDEDSEANEEEYLGPPVLREDHLQVLNQLLQVPGREIWTTVLSPLNEPNTIWFGRDKGVLVRECTKVFTNKFDDEYYSWTVVPRKRQKTHTWTPLYTGAVQKHFKRICQRRMKGMVSTVRTSQKRPRWIEKTLWTRMTTYWDTEEAKTRSSTTSTARKSNSGGFSPPIHTSGQKSYEQIQQKIEEDLQRPVSISEVFIRTHTKKDGTLVDLRAKKITEDYIQKLAEEKETNAEGDQPRDLSIDEQKDISLLSISP